MRYLKMIVRTFSSDTSRCMAGYSAAIRQFTRGKKRSTKKLEEIYFWGRLLVRSFFAEVEGTVWAIRQVLLAASERGEIDLTERQKEKLGDTYFSIIEAVKLAFRKIEVLVGRNLTPEDKAVDSKNYEAFRELLQLRHRITHPKNLTSLQLSFEELSATILAGRTWYSSRINALLETDA